MEKRGARLVVPHSAIEPMGRKDLLLIELDTSAKPQRIKILPEDVAGSLMRVAHGSQGASFPGFNLPLLRVLPKKTSIMLQRFVEAQRSKNTSGADLAGAALELFSETSAAVFTDSQTDQFRRSTQELVSWMKDDLAGSGPELENVRNLLDIVDRAELELQEFAENLANCICRAQPGLSRNEVTTFFEWIFGKTYLPKCKDPVGSESYWEAKTSADHKWQEPIFLDLASGNTEVLPVADPRTGRRLNDYLLSLKPLPYDKKARIARVRRVRSVSQKVISAKDAYTGKDCTIPDTFPEPKLAFLGNTRLFSNNTAEAGAFFRYGLGEAETFKVSADLAEKMSGAIFTLAGDDLALVALGGRASVGRTCRDIPGTRGNKNLLIAYLEDEPDASDPWVEFFGGEAANYNDPDFAASAKLVLEALEGKVAANPNQLIRLIAIAPLDKANKQISLNRSFTVREVMRAANDWQAGAANCPPVSLRFFNKESRKAESKLRTVPSPLDTALVINRVWTSQQDGGPKHEFHRAITASDAFDIFVDSLATDTSKTRFALKMLITRMRSVFSATGSLKVTSDFRILSEVARWQVLKAVALMGIFLHQLREKHEIFMKEPIYQTGRLLALADTLHFQYCKFVRTTDESRKQKKVNAPSELIGNALFNFALDNPIAALARLAERIRPYKGWADTYSGEDAGLVHWLVRQMSECERQLDTAGIPPRMEDIDKAKLLLGYLADHTKPEDKKE
jgi:hypothetical protein